MAILDDVIGVFSPGWKAARLRSRAVIQAYEAVKTTRTHKARRENRTADQLSQYGAVSLREQARYLDNNHDLVIGVFDKLEERVVGKNGIIVEPHPVLRNGAIARDLAAEIRTRWSEWSVSPEVTGQFTRPMLERLMLRTWLRDGEVFAQMVSGRINSLTPSAGVHFWLEALEPDFIPMTSDESNRLNQGVFVDDWGRPEKYLVYKSRPVSGRQMETKEVDAERMLHLKFVRRLHQMRGTSLLSGVLIRLSALKEYEDSELTAARIAAALGMYIRKGDGQSYEPDGNGSKDKERELTIQPPGMARICLYGDLQRFGRRIDLRVKTGSEAIRALAMQIPAFRQKLSDGWYQVRIAGRDAGETELSARLNEPLANGAVIHIVPRLAGAKSGGVFQVVLGAALIAVAWWNPVGWLGAAAVSGMYAAGASMILGGVAQMLAPKARTPTAASTDNGKQNTYFSSLDNMVAQGNVLPVLYGEMRVGSRVVSQEISTADEGDGGQVVVIGR